MQGRNIRHAIIGRLRRYHSAYGLDPDEIREIIATELLSYIDAADVVYIPPNYIIHLHTPYAQQAILADPILETNHFQLEMVPWSKEHELAQLPWLQGEGTESSKIFINPLEILLVVPSDSRSHGSSRLMDSFAAKIPKNYDLRAPDLSYLLITELKNFYMQKFHTFMESKTIAGMMCSTMTEQISAAEKLFPNIALHYQHKQENRNIIEIHNITRFFGDLRTTVANTAISFTDVCTSAAPTVNHAHMALDLEHFREGPPAIEIKAPPTYAARLKIIYATAIKKIYSTTPIIETIKTTENRYETYVTIDGFTRRYFGSHTRSAASMEAAAVYYGLKQLTNVQGYQILDLNYPTLETLVHHIHDWDSEINDLQIFSRVATEAAENIWQIMHNKCSEAELQKLEVHNLQPIRAATEALLTIMDQLYDSTVTLREDLNASKAAYDAHRIGIYSPTRSVLQWGRATRPSMS